MAYDTLTLMDFEEGNLSETEIVELLADLIQIGEIYNFPKKFIKLANSYIRKGVLDNEGNINYIKLNMEG